MGIEVFWVCKEERGGLGFVWWSELWGDLGEVGVMRVSSFGRNVVGR